MSSPFGAWFLVMVALYHTPSCKHKETGRYSQREDVSLLSEGSLTSCLAHSANLFPVSGFWFPVIGNMCLDVWSVGFPKGISLMAEKYPMELTTGYGFSFIVRLRYRITNRIGHPACAWSHTFSGGGMPCSGHCLRGSYTPRASPACCRLLLRILYRR